MTIVDPIGASAEPPRRLSAAGAVAVLALTLAMPLLLTAAGAVVPLVLGGTLGLAMLGRVTTGRWPTSREAWVDALVMLALALARDDAATVWQAPAEWTSLLRLTTPGTIAAALLYIGVATTRFTRLRRHIDALEAIAVLVALLLFNMLLLLGNDTLLNRLGFWLTGEVALDDRWRGVIGRAATLIVIVEAMTATLKLLVAGRLPREARLHVLLIGMAVHAALGPTIADITQGTAALGMLGQLVLAAATAALAQAGLWSITFTLTGFAIDALGQRPPTLETAWSHWRSGLVRGAIYGGVFMALLLIAGDLLQQPAIVAALKAAPLPAGGALGIALFPLAATIVASADGTPPFVGRLLASYRTPRSYARGAVVGLGAALALRHGLPSMGGGTRFLLAAAVGALAYGGIDAAAEAIARAAGGAARAALWRQCVLGLALGAFVGGALGWYFDAAQVDVVATKFWSYVALTTGKAEPYTIYPLFNKWGVIALGPSGGGVRLFFNESLSGVINWGIAAPLFGINYFVLAALFGRSLRPLRQLASPDGFRDLVAQTVRVLRWGLWMAPVINSFLRQSPDPSWYNQDGLVRTAAATAAAAALPPATFREWSLSIFTGLLAYDWLRVLIWFDHMGLRVATLVNLTFIGGDRADEAAARFVGHAARTRVMPDGIRRFATWAPLLIPFYIPHGADWDRAWTGAEQMRKAAAPLPSAVSSLMVAYGMVAVVVGLLVLAFFRRHDRPRTAIADALQRPRGLIQAPGEIVLANGAATSHLQSDGLGWLTIEGATRGTQAIDIGRRVTDPLQLRGPFIYLQDPDAGSAWSAAFQPTREVGADYRVDAGRTSVAIRHTLQGIESTLAVSLMDDMPVERCTLVLVNTGDRPRRIVVTSYRDIGLNEPGAYARDPDFNAIHVESCFVGALQALMMRNRLLRGGQAMSPELAVHAVRLPEGAVLTGYEDSRTRFIGKTGLRRPLGLQPGRPRQPDDDGLLATFDPAASLTVTMELPAGARREITFVTGWAKDVDAAAALTARLTGRPLPAADALAAVWRRRRTIEPLPLPPASSWPFAFGAGGDTLDLTPETPRPWAHVLANPGGYGTVVSNEGEIHSFNGNARQNALTPFRFESVPTHLPGQLVYVTDVDTGEIVTPGFLPFRRAAARHTLHYRPGSATFTSSTDGLVLDLQVFVPPDVPADLRILTVRNDTGRARRLRVVPYFEMVLAESAEDSRGLLDRDRDEGSGTLLFANATNDFQRGWAFAATSLMDATTETVRSRFLGGAGRDLTEPFLVATGAPASQEADDGRRCAAFAATLTLAPGASTEIAIVLGQAPTRREALDIAARLADPLAARAALTATHAWWAERLGDIQVETSDPAFDRLVNTWLPYQALASRLWGRNGPNQRGGATGFRDQLQDVLPFLFSDPALARRQVVIHAGAQFPEGDVFKWWHRAPDGRTGLGQRTHASDPHLWLPYVLTRYIEATGDRSVLDERAAYLEGPPVPPDRLDLLIAPRASGEIGDVYGHARRAIDYTLARFGPHGLPLVGTADWNDGIDAAGDKGRGESVWLALFFHDILRRFLPLVGEREGEAAAATLESRAAALRGAIDGSWTGDHFVFDYTDDGRPLDPPSIMTAAWPALSGAVVRERARAALDHGLQALGRPDRILLLSPPFDEHSDPYPGRIADYPPGVRENGGQYSHGASWSVDALIELAGAAAAAGDPEEKAALLSRAAAAWRAISPLGKTEGETLAVYGLAPHQQPADIYDGEGYAGRGGWSWYTGSAARMLSAAYALVGLTMRDGEVGLAGDAFEPRGDLVLRSVRLKGRVLGPTGDEESEAAQ